MSNNNKVEDYSDHSLEVPIISKEKKFIYHDIYLYEFSEANNFTKVFNLLSSAEENDIINIYLNNPGGYISTGIQLLNSLNISRALEINVHVQAPVYSMAALFTVAAFKKGAKIHLGEDVYLMFHDYSGGNIGKGNELIIKAVHDRKWTNDFFKNCTYPFLSLDEIDRLVKGEDFYISRKEAIKRFKRVHKEL